MVFLVLNLLVFLCPVLILGIWLIYFCQMLSTNRGWASKKFSFLCGMFFATFGYGMEAKWDNDLTRYYEKIENIKVYEGLNTILLNDANKLYTQDILFYFVKKSGDLHLLPYIVGLIIYGIAYYVAFDMIEKSKHQFKRHEVLSICFMIFAIITPYSVIGNVRCVLAYTIISFAVYRELIQRKKNIFTYFLYIIPLGLHSSAIIIIILRLFLSALKKAGKAILVIPFILPPMIGILYNIRNVFGNSLIGRLLYDSINKAYYYLNWTEGGWASEVANSISDKMTRIYGTFFLLIILGISILTKDKKLSLLNSLFNVYIFSIAMCALGCLTIKTGAFWRFEAVVILFSPVIFVQLYERESKITNMVINVIIITTIFIFCANLVILYRNLNIRESLLNTISVNGFTILQDIFRGLGII